MHLLIAAAGSGSRMGANCNKLLLQVAGSPILKWTLDAAIAAESITWIGIIGQSHDQKKIQEIISSSSKPVKWILGGKSRQESVQKGLAALPQDAHHVLIHDGARCLVDPELFDQCSEIVQSGVAVIAATPVIDTIKKVDDMGFITETPAREGLWAAQTPQGFLVDKLKEGHKIALLNNWSVTDDASLFERLGWPVKILESVVSNLKVTTPFDLTVAEAIIAMKK